MFTSSVWQLRVSSNPTRTTRHDSISDGLLLLSVIPSIVEKYNEGNFPFGEIGCKLTSFFTYICMICTRFSIVVLALDRFIAVR
jgi:hypothetical protein